MTGDRPVPTEALPDLDPEPGWRDVWPFPFRAAHRSFTGPAGMHGMAHRYFLRDSDDALIAKVWFGASCEGAPGRVHGGGVLTVLDEAIGAAAWVKGLPVLTARLDTRFRRGIPLCTELLVETKLLQIGGRTIRASGRLLDKDGVCHAEAEGVYARLSEERVRGLYGDAAAKPSD